MKIRSIINLSVIILSILSVFDTIITLYGLTLGFEETNLIIIIFMKTFGDIKGIILADIVKLSLIGIAYTIYQRADKEMDKFRHRVRLCNTLNRIVAISFIVPIITTLAMIYQNIVIIFEVLQK